MFSLTVLVSNLLGISLFSLHWGALISRLSLGWVVWYLPSVQVSFGSKEEASVHFLRVCSGSAEHGMADSLHKPGGTTLRTFAPNGSLVR